MKKPKSRRHRDPKHPDKKDDRRDKVEMIERVQRTFRTRWGKKSELEHSNPVEVDTRHNCRNCGRKREERFMHVVGQGAFGKKSWGCCDSFQLCNTIRDHKLKLKSK